MTLNQNKNSELTLDNESFDLKEMEQLLSQQLEESFSDLHLLEKEKELISNPDSIGKVILDEVWTQFGNQIGLDVTNETLIQKYDRENPEDYNVVGREVMADQRYKNSNKVMKDKHEKGILKDEYTGKKLKANEQPNLDHVVSRKELFDNKRRKQAGLDVKDLANKDENLKPTNQSLNKSKREKRMEDYVATQEQRRKDLIEQNKRANEKIDQSNKSEADKKAHKDKNDRYLKNKLDADEKLMMENDDKARGAINQDIRKGATKNAVKKAGKDALKAMLVSSLFAMLKEIVQGLVRFFKQKKKSLQLFLVEMKASVKRFFTKIFRLVQNGASNLIGTIISEIFGPIVSVFKRLSSMIKQSVATVMDAINYLKDKENKDKPISVKMAQIGKIVTAGLVAGGGIMLVEVFEKTLLTVPGLQTPIPGLGSIANLVGLFLSGLVAGLVGAIVLHYIDKFIARKLQEESTVQMNEKKNDILQVQHAQIVVTENMVARSRNELFEEMKENHAIAKEQMQQSLTNIFDSDVVNIDYTEKQNELDDEFERMQKELEELL